MLRASCRRARLLGGLRALGGPRDYACLRHGHLDGGWWWELRQPMRSIMWPIIHATIGHARSTTRVRCAVFFSTTRWAGFFAGWNSAIHPGQRPRVVGCTTTSGRPESSKTHSIILDGYSSPPSWNQHPELESNSHDHGRDHDHAARESVSHIPGGILDTFVSSRPSLHVNCVSNCGDASRRPSAVQYFVETPHSRESGSRVGITRKPCCPQITELLEQHTEVRYVRSSVGQAWVAPASVERQHQRVLGSAIIC